MDVEVQTILRFVLRQVFENPAWIGLIVSLSSFLLAAFALRRTYYVDVRSRLAHAVDQVRLAAEQHLYVAVLIALAKGSGKEHNELELDEMYSKFKTAQASIGHTFSTAFHREFSPPGTYTSERSLTCLQGDRTWDALNRTDELLRSLWKPRSRERLPLLGKFFRAQSDKGFTAVDLGRPHSTFAVHSSRGKKGTLHLIVPLANGSLRHYWRPRPLDEHHRWGCETITLSTHANPSLHVDAACCLQSNFGYGNLEVIARVGHRLCHVWGDAPSDTERADEPTTEGCEGKSNFEWHKSEGTGLTWLCPTPHSTLTSSQSTHQTPPISVGGCGPPAFIQSMFGGRGNFEVVVPSLGQDQFIHCWRANDTFAQAWTQEDPFPVKALQGWDEAPRWESVALAHTRIPVGIRGTLEAVGRAGKLLWHFRRSPYPPWGQWEVLGGKDREGQDPIYDGATGVPALIQLRGRDSRSVGQIYLITPTTNNKVILMSRRGDDPGYARWKDHHPIAEDFVENDPIRAASVVQLSEDGTGLVAVLLEHSIRLFKGSFTDTPPFSSKWSHMDSLPLN